MRRVDAEGDSQQSNRRRHRSEARTSPGRKAILRRASLESLEARTLLSGKTTLVSTLPEPVTQVQSFVGQSLSGAGNSSSPSVAIDPVNSQKMVAVWTVYDPANKIDGLTVTTYAEGAYSVDGGTTWKPMPSANFGNTTGLLDSDTQTNFSVAPSTTAPQPNFAQTTDATVSFGRNESVYVLTSTHDAGSVNGVLDLMRWDFTSQTPATQTFNAAAYDQFTGFFGSPTLSPVYRWQGADSALTPTLAVDSNVASFNDGTTKQTDPYSGNVYIAWETNDTPPKGATVPTTYNANTIKLMSSSNQGQDFTYQAYLNGHGSGNLYDLPRIAISQGSATVSGGQVTIVYDNAGPGGGPNVIAPFFDEVLTQADKTGGTDAHGDSATNVLIKNATKDGFGSGIDAPATTNIPILINITDPQFTTLQNLTVTLSLEYPTLDNTSATLTSPDGLTTVTLWNNKTNNAGGATKLPGVITGANIGATTDGFAGSSPFIPFFIGTTLDSTADRSLFDGNAAAPYTAHFQPFDNLQATFQGLGAAALNGNWTLSITDYRNETAASPRTLIGASLDLTSGNSDITNNTASLVAFPTLNSGGHPYTGGISSIPVFASPSIASDNTLGSNSPHEGRLYIALTDDNFNDVSGAYTSSTFIELYTSDNGGTTWSYAGIVNDDNGLKDGFSTGGYAQTGSGVGVSLTPPLASDFNMGVPYFGDPHANVRPKIEPQVAVDNQTGTLVVSFLDTRNDAAAVRVATYIAASTDGGASFAPETYANPTTNNVQSQVVDAITGNPVTLGPIPDNQSSGNFASDPTFGFGQRQGLAVAGGMIIPVWASNENGGNKTFNVKQPLFIQSAQVTVAAGPRVLSGTQGPIGQPGDMVNTSRELDGTPIANTIVITFDRAVAPSSFPADGSTIGTSPLEVFYNNPSGTPAPVPLRVLTVTPDATNTIYTITFDPTNLATGLPYGVGSYSYTLRPTVRGLIPFVTTTGTNATEQVPFVDSAVSNGQNSFTVTGYAGIMLTAATLAAKVDIYQQGTSTGSPTDLQIFLTAADGTRYTLYSGTTKGQTQGTAFNVSNSISIPAIPAEMLDQTFTIQVVDNVPGEKVFLYNDINPTDFNFQVTLSNQALASDLGNFLDQNSNAIPGESPADNYSVPNGRNSLPLIVPGPHVSSTSATGVKNTASTGSDNLVNNDTVNSIKVTFDRDMQVSSFTPARVLSIVGPTGRIDGPQTFPSTGTSRTFAYNGSYQFIPKAGTLTSTLLIAKTGLTVSNLNVQVNITDPMDQTLQLILVAPDGRMIPLVNTGTATGANFTNTTFSDTPAANGLTSTIPAGTAPYSLTYQPASPLAALAGEILDGTWKLMISDSSANGPQGRLNAWSLNVTPQVPKGAGATLNSTLNINSYPDNSFKIAHLAVQLNITSTMDSDLQVYLVAPDGTTVIPLILNAGGSGANFINTILDDNATIPIASGVAPFTLSYQPAAYAINPLLSLNQLNGLSIEGTWTLRIVNPNNDNSVTTLNSWSLIASPQLTVTAVSPVGNAARIFKVGFPTQQLSGTYNITLSPNILSVAPNPANPSMGTPLDTNLNAGVYSLEGISVGATTTVTYPATAVPVTIPYAKKTPLLGTIPGVLTSQLNVPDNFAIQGDVGTVAGLTVSFDITYYNDPDLSVTLTAPNGKSVTLFMNVGKGSRTADFTNTTLSDTVTPVAPITAAGAPFFGTFDPQFPLAAFKTDLSNNQAFSQGLWTLTITNVGTDPGSNINALYPPTLNRWSLALQRPQTNTGLGEPVADQVTVGFRLFNLAPTNALANDTWTAVGPAGTISAGNSLVNLPVGNPGGVNLAGPVSVVAVDSADPSGNTAYIGASSGGIWKTNNFLTNNPSGPTYLPLTDFGANYAVNIGGIAIFDQNNDPNQSVIFAGTGNGQATTATVGNSVQGIGFLRSINGGASFTLLDSSVNVDSNGNPLPINSPLRDHIFVGTTTYKVIVDPTPLAGGGIIVYAALGGKNGGLWRSLDSGNHWSNLSVGVIPQVNGNNATATDILLDPASASASSGNLNILYAAFQGIGVFISTSRGLALTEMFGQVGADNLIQNAGTVPATPLTVKDASPNGAFGRIILGKPALTTNTALNILYQDWLYVAVENTNGTFHGLFVTKDRGENWTNAQIASNLTPVAATAIPTEALPTNNNLQTNNYDVTNPVSGTVRLHNGNSAFSMAIDPLNPNIVYLGGTSDYQDSGLIRVDLTGLYDAHAYVPYADNRNDGGILAIDSTGRVNVNPLAFTPLYLGTNPNDPTQRTGLFYLNLRHNPQSPFVANATLYVANSTAFTNDGTGVQWIPLDTSYALPLQGSSNLHQIYPIIDPLTGLTRLIFADDQGVFTGLFNGDGTLSTSGLGTAPSVIGSLNGNLQDEELYYSAAQPSALAATAAGALFYGSGIGLTNAQSPSNLLSTGNLTWTVQGPGYGDNLDVILSNDRGGTGIATDQTGGISATNPMGNPSLYEYDVPLLGGDATNFFRVNTNGQTTGLVNNYPVEFPSNNALSNGNGVTQLGNFTVNPIDGSQILISSNLGNVYETTNQGVQWNLIGSGSTNFDNTYASALAYGAPDPNGPNGVGNLNNIIYVGTIGGHIYMTQTGSGPWTPLNNGLNDGSSIVSIYTNPNRASHEAYAVTLKAVYYMADSTVPNAMWVNITGNLTQIQHNSFGDPTLAQSTLLGYANGQFGGFRSIVADYRYAIPDPVLSNVMYPVLYVAGYGGVFRSLDNGQTWTAFPNTAFDSAPVNGGYLPSVDVTSLTLNLGAINPATGHATQRAGDREILLASTLGRGDFAIGLAPVVLPNTIQLDPNLPSPGGSDSGAANGNPDVTNVVTPYIDGVSEISNFGNTITITIYDETTGPGRGLVLGTGTTDPLGHFVIQLVNDGSDPSFFTSSTSIDDKIIGVQAKDISGATGNITLFAYTLDTIKPSTPTSIKLESQYDTGRSNSDNNTNLSVPAQTGPGAALTIVTPIFDVATPLPPANPLTPFPITLTAELVRSTSPTFPVGPNTVIVDMKPSGTTSPVKLSDAGLATLAASGINQTFYYEAIQFDQAGNVSNTSPVLNVYVNTIAPAAPTSLTLTSILNNGVNNKPTQPAFSVTGLLTGGTPTVSDQLFLYRSNPQVNGGALVLAGISNVGETTVYDGENLSPPQSPNSDGKYTYYVAQQDVFGNYSVLLSPGVAVTINTQVPPNTPILEPTYDTGRFNNDDITNVAIPMPTPGGTPNYLPPVFDVITVAPPVGQPATKTVELLRSTSLAGPFVVVGSAAYSATGTTSVPDATLTTLLAPPSNTVYYYESDQVDTAGITSKPSAPLKVTVDNITPPTLPAPTLDITTNTGLVPSQNITNNTHPLIDATGLGMALGASNQLFLYRATGGNKPILVGTAAIGISQVMDTVGATPDAVYQYSVVQVDLAGNVSNYSQPVVVTINTTIPAAPTISLLMADNTGLPSHPNVTNKTNPTVLGTAPYNALPNFPLDILVVTNGNNAAGVVVGSTFPASNGTYQVKLTTALVPDGVYTLVARTRNQAGTPNYSAPLTITVKATGPQTPPSLAIVNADDTGIKGDGVTANHHPRFTGVTDKGDTVTIYALVNGVLSAPQATTTSSTIDGSFTIQLPYNLVDGTTQLVAQTSDIAGNVSVLGTSLNLRIISVAGDYLGTGAAQIAIFDPNTETYFVRGGPVVQADPGSSYRDVPEQYDFSGTGLTNFVAYRLDTATHFGVGSNGSNVNIQYGLGGVSLPVPGYFNPAGIFTLANFGANYAYWAVALPQPGGLFVQFVVPRLDIPTPAAYQGGGLTELAVFRPSPSSPGALDADSFSIAGIVSSANPIGYYQVSFTNPAITNQGFVYKAGDLAAPADYDGVGYDEPTIYRPSTGQFFIVNTHNSFNSANWVLRTVTMNLPGGPNGNDVPVSEDYDGNGKIDPSVYRPSNSTFYVLHSSTGKQENIQYGLGAFGGRSSFDIAPAGPLLYRLTALQGKYASNGGYPTITGTGGSPVGGANSITLHASALSTTPPSSTPVPSTIALAAPLVFTTPSAPAVSASTTTSTLPVAVGVTTPKSHVPTATTKKSHETTNGHHAKAAHKPKTPAPHLAVTSKVHAVEAKAPAAHSESRAPQLKAQAATLPKPGVVMAAMTALQNLVMARKGKPKA